MKTPYRIFIAIISSMALTFLPPGNTWSCGPEMNADEMTFSLFQQNLAGQDGLSSFYYNQDFVGSFTSDPDNTDYKRNCEEWRAFTGNKATANDIYAIEYDDDTTGSFITAAITHDWRKFSNNTFIQWLIQPRNKAALQYFVLAKENENATAVNNVWGDNDRTYPDSLATIAVKKCRTKLPEFLRERYAFQAVKTYFYDRNRKLTACYDAYLKGKNTIVAAWAALYYGLAQTDSLKSTYYLVQAFSKSEEKKGYVHQFLTRQALTDLEATVKDPAILTDIRAIRGMKDPGRDLDDIKKIYDYDPGNRYLPLLICREVNKLEDWLLSPEVLSFQSPLRMTVAKLPERSEGQPDTTYAYYAQKNRDKDQRYLQQVITQLIFMLNHGYKDPALLKLAIVRLYHMQHNFADAQVYLAGLGNLKDSVYMRQAAIEQTVNFICTADITGPQQKQQLWQLFQRLKQLGLAEQKKDEGDYEDYMDNGGVKNTLSKLYLLLSEQYRTKGDICTAGLLFIKAGIQVNDYYGNLTDSGINYGSIAYFDKYATAGQVEGLIRFKHRRHKTAFEQMLVPGNWAPDNFYHDLEGTILVRQFKFQEALVVMNKIPDNFWQDNYEYKTYLPATSVSSVGSLVPGGSGPVRKYKQNNKKEMLRDIIALQVALQKPMDNAAKANAYFLLGNAYYNLSYNGKAWMMFSYGKSYDETRSYTMENYTWAWYSFYPNSVTYGAAYYGCAKAAEMYKYAYACAGGQKELSAKILMMRSLCDDAAHDYLQSLQDKKGIISNDQDDDKAYYSPYLKTLFATYRSTHAVRLALTECPDIAAYATKHGR